MSAEVPITMSSGELESQLQFCKIEEPLPREKRTFTPDARVISDAILGLSDGLTVPFALTAGLSALGTSRLVVLGGLAELMAGAISMGLGGFVGAKSEAESYQATSRTCDFLIKSSPTTTSSIIHSHFAQYALPPSTNTLITTHLTTSPQTLKSFLLTHHFHVTAPPPSRPYISALTLGAAYIFGGIIPLMPYFFVANVDEALFISIGLMAVVLLVFGYVKTGVVRGWRGGENVRAACLGSLQMLVVGAVAAGAAVGLVRALDQAGGLE